MPATPPLPPLVDSHCHLTWPSFDGDRDAVIERMKAAGVEQAVVIATTVEDARRAAALCDRHEGLYPTAGIHPNDLPPADELEAELDALEALVRDGGFVAIGETGLDYYRDDTEPEPQRRAFHRQAALAVENDLPVVVHIRDRDGSVAAYDDVAEVIESHPGLRGVIHCYTGDPAHAARYLESDFVVSFSGIVTFPKGENVRESALAVPIERMLIETDAPFLAPQPRRGKRNEPGFVVFTAQAIAALKGISEADVRRITTRNTRRLFRLAAEDSIGPATYTIRDAIYVNVTNACDARCTFCPRTHDDYEVKGYDLRRPRDPTFEQIVEEIGDPTRWSEVVFCGFGEPTLRLDVVKRVSEWVKEQGGSGEHRGRTRLNTNGHADLIHKRPTAAELVGLVDVVSVSLNAQDRETFERHCPSAFSPDGFTPMLDYIRSALAAGLEVVCTAVAGLEGVDMAATERLATGLGARWRGRSLDQVG